MRTFKTRIFFDEGGETSEPAPTSNEGGDKGQNEVQLPEGAIWTNDWRAALPEDLRDHPSLQKVKDIEGLARSNVNAQKMVGNRNIDRMVELPDPTEVTPENRREVLQKIGLPEQVDGAYKLELPQDVPQEHVVRKVMDPSTEFGKAFLGKCHELGIFPDQAQGLYNHFAQAVLASEKGQAKELERQEQENEDNLRAELGETFDTVTKTAGMVADKLGIRKELEEAGLGTNPNVIKGLSKMRGLLDEDTIGDNRSTGPTDGGMTPDNLRQQARELQEQSMKTGIDRFEQKRLQQKAQEYYARAAKFDRKTA